MAVYMSSGENQHQTVLLAEDESMIRELIAIFLSNLGYTVVEAENGKAAFNKAKELGPDKIGLLITDLVMPVMGGLELAAELRKLAEDLRVLFISGYTDDVVVLDNEGPARTAFLKKPFNFESLKSRVEELLADRQEAGSEK
jgi:CheY-like chemotaxis protein